MVDGNGPLCWGWDLQLDELSRETNAQETAWEMDFFNENLIFYNSKGWAAGRKGSRSQPDSGKCFQCWFLPVEVLRPEA